MSLSPAVAIFQASHSRKAAPIQLSARNTVGLARTTLPSPNATTNIITPMPTATPIRQGSPRSTPTLAPVAVSRRLLGPGVPAAATAKSRNATACSGVMMSEGWYGAMVENLHGAGGAGLERSCEARRSDWLRSRELPDGVQVLQAWFAGHGFDKHRHDTYAIGLTDVGVQAFDYRGVAEISTPGQVVVLHPDETHDGRAGTPDGFGYRIVYVAPARIHEAARAIRGRPCALPFAREPVTADETLASTIEAAFRVSPEPWRSTA